MTRRLRARTFLLIALPLTIGVAWLSMVQGYAEIAAMDVLKAVAAELGLADPLHPDDQLTVVTIRLPRVLIAFFGGAALAILQFAEPTS